MGICRAKSINGLFWPKGLNLIPGHPVKVSRIRRKDDILIKYCQIVLSLEDNRRSAISKNN